MPGKTQPFFVAGHTSRHCCRHWQATGNKVKLRVAPVLVTPPEMPMPGSATSTS